jgi:iron complex outermembrane receptor protein
MLEGVASLLAQAFDSRLPQLPLWRWATGPLLAGCAFYPVQAQEAPVRSDVQHRTAALPDVTVVDSAGAQRRFDSAASHSVVDIDSVAAPAPLVHLSEVLAGQPGIVATDRGNYAQDLQIAVRGFGARSTFGVRGVRVLVDGIPATMPDGQGQAATAHLSTASQVEVLRGPLAQQYGNAAGGVVQVTTRDPRPDGGAQVGAAWGASGQRLAEATLDFGDQRLGGIVGLTHFETDGWRAHSAARRTHVNAKLLARPDSSTRITGLLNLYTQPLTQDPLGLTRAQYLEDPRQAASVATTFNTRKSVDQNQAGLVVDRRVSTTDSVQLRAYGGTRQLTQYLSFSGAALNSAGGVVDLDRHYGGAGMTWTRTVRRASGLPVTLTAGLETHRLWEDRLGLVNDAGTRGALRRDEQTGAANTDAHVQVDTWLSPRWRIVAGLRSSVVRVSVDDRFVAPPSNPDDSGSRRWRNHSPALGLVWAATEHLNVYANIGRGFETPTVSEMAYSMDNTGPNFGLQAARSRQWEVGAKWRSADGHEIDAAWFDTRTRGEIVPAATVNGRSVFQNTDNVRRRGLELAWRARHGSWTSRASYAYLDAYFASPYTGTGGVVVAPGNRLPGTGRHIAHVAIDYAATPQWQLGATLHASGSVFANDLNSERAPGFGVVGVQTTYRVGSSNTSGADTTEPRWLLWARLDNLLDRRYAGSLIVNDGNGRFFEPSAGRRLMVGLRARFL